MEFFYFHNCLYEGVWKDNPPAATPEKLETRDLHQQIRAAITR